MIGEGHLLEASLQDLRDTQEKEIELKRCSDSEVLIN